MCLGVNGTEPLCPCELSARFVGTEAPESARDHPRASESTRAYPRSSESAREHLQVPSLVEGLASRGHNEFYGGNREHPLTWWLGLEEVSFKSFCHMDAPVLSRPNAYCTWRVAYATLLLKGSNTYSKSLQKVKETRSCTSVGPSFIKLYMSHITMAWLLFSWPRFHVKEPPSLLANNASSRTIHDKWYSVQIACLWRPHFFSLRVEVKYSVHPPEENTCLRRASCPLLCGRIGREHMPVYLDSSTEERTGHTGNKEAIIMIRSQW